MVSQLQLFVSANTSPVEDVDQSPLDAWHVAGLRIAYKMQRDMLNKEKETP